MFERVQVKVGREYYRGDLVREATASYLVRLDATGKVIACAKSQVVRWMRQ